MGAAWRTKGKTFQDKLVIYRFLNDQNILEYWTEADGQVVRSWAEHQVCSGEARYVNGRAPA